MTTSGKDAAFKTGQFKERVADHEAGEDSIVLRNKQGVKRELLNKERSVTTVVSEVFDFLNQNSSAGPVDMEEAKSGEEAAFMTGHSVDGETEVSVEEDAVNVMLRHGQAVKHSQHSKERTPTAIVTDAFDFLNLNPSAALNAVEESERHNEQGDHLYSNIDVDEEKVKDLGKPVDEFHSKDSGFASLERQIGDKNDASMYDSFVEIEDGTKDINENGFVESADTVSYINHFVEGNDRNDDRIPANAGNDDSIYDDVDVPLIPDSKSSDVELPSTCVSSEGENAIVMSAESFGGNSGNTVCAAEKVDNSCVNQTQGDNPSASTESKVTVINISTGRRTALPVKSCTEEDELEKNTENCVKISPSVEYVVNLNEHPEGLVKSVSNKENFSDKQYSAENLAAVRSHSRDDNEYDKIITLDMDNDSGMCNGAKVKEGGTSKFAVQSNDFVVTVGKSGGNSQTEKAALEQKLPAPVMCEESEYFNIPVAMSSVSSDDDDDDDDDDNSDPQTTCSTTRASVSDQAYASIDVEETSTKLTEIKGQVSEAKPDAASMLVDNSVPRPGSENAGTRQSTESVDLASGPHDNEHVSSVHVAHDVSETTVDIQTIGEENRPVAKESTAQIVRRPKLEKNPSAELASDDSSDEDIGIYAESFRRSNWIRVSQDGKLEIKMLPSSSQLSSKSSQSSSSSSTPQTAGDSINEDSTDGDINLSPKADEVFSDPLSQATMRNKLLHKRSDSTTTTASEKEFKNQYVSRRKCLIQRADSQQEYHRLSSRVYDQDKQVVVERIPGSDDLGLHILDSHPAFITSVDPDSAADQAGITEGQIIVTVNDQNVLFTDHTDIVELIQSCKERVKLGVANSDFQPVRDLQAVIMSGYMYKLGNSAFMKIWKKRHFVLRQDNCLYYYKNDQDLDPLGALPLCGYTISRHTDTNKDFCFKAEKYRARTYFFMTDNRDQLTEWVGALTEAAARSKKRKESFLSVSSHNVGLPALDIRKPECSGTLGKLSPSKRNWRRRYCVLKDACIYYYKEMNSLNALGVAHLHGYTVDVESHPRRKFSFSLQPPEKKMRIFYFSADNETDKKRWVESLIHSIQRWVRVDKEAEC